MKEDKLIRNNYTSRDFKPAKNQMEYKSINSNITKAQPKNAKIFHQNIDRLSNKIERLNHYLELLKPDIVAISEHGLSRDTLPNAMLFDYSLASAYCRENHRKGGIALYKLNNNAFTIDTHSIEHLSQELICEMAAIRITTGNGFLFIIRIYRPPSSPLKEALLLIAAALDTIPANNKGICIVGDLNVDSLRNTNDKRILNNLLSSYDILRLDIPPTRITNTSVSSIDVVCTNLNKSSVNVEIVSSGLSDHTGQITTLEILTRVTAASTLNHRLFNARNIALFKDLIVSQNWDRVYQATSTDKAYDNFINTLTTILDISCPFRKTKLKKKPNYYNTKLSNPELDHLRKQFIKANDRFLVSNQETYKIQASQLKKEYDLKLKSARREASEAFISESANKGKAIWQIINRERAARKKNEDISWKLAISGEIVTDAPRVADHFNSFFTTIAEKTLKANNPQKTILNDIVQQNPGSLLIAFTPTSRQEVREIMDKMKPSSSAGIDDISARLLKHCQDEVCLPLVDIINKSLSQGVFPQQLKTSKVYPLHKQGEKDEISNYRPISLVPTVSKIMEKIVLKRLTQHLTVSHLLPDRQHGFMTGKSTLTALVELVEHIVDSIEGGNTVTTTLLDLSKAFDCLSHSRLLEKLASLGIRSTPLKWFKNYLEGRMQVVEIKQASRENVRTVKSSPLNINRGVPQGSVLGPVLFILYTSDLPLYLDACCRPVMYADDTALLTIGKTAESLEIASFISLSIAKEYCDNNDLVLNERKTKQIILGRHKNDVSGLPGLTLTESTKHLGMTIDDCLSWNEHLESLCKKLSTAIFVLRRIKSTSTPAATLTAYYALFESHARYGIVLWGGSSSGNLQKVLVLQKQALRALEGLNSLDSCRPTFKTLKILTIPSIYILETILYCSKQNLNRADKFHHYHTRNGIDFTLPMHRTELFARKPSYAGAKLFNLLPPGLKTEDPMLLRKRLREWLLADPIYSLEEFKTRTQRLDITI